MTRKKKHQKVGRLVSCGTKIQNLIMWYGNDQMENDLGKGRKLGARLEAKEKGGEV